MTDLHAQLLPSLSPPRSLRLGTLRDNEIERLRNRITELEGLLGMAPILPWRIKGHGIGPRCYQMLGLLLKRNGVVTRDFAFSALYGNNSDINPRVIDQHIHRLNKRLKVFSIKIMTEPFIGYYLLDADRLKLREMGWGG